MKKRKLVRFILFILIFSCILNLNAAVSESLDFDIHWYVNNNKTTTISILPYSGSGVLPQDEHGIYLKDILPSNNNSLYNICLVKYETNEKGTHKLEFSATPFVERSALEKYAYSLYITYNNSFPIILNVDPNELDNSKFIDISIVNAGKITTNIYLDAVISSYDEMTVGNYSSTITITRYSE